MAKYASAEEGGQVARQAKPKKPLTDTVLKNAKPESKPYLLADQFGLSVQVTPNGSKLWRFRYTFDGKGALCSLGSYPQVSLAEAREERDRLRKLVKKGIRPTDDRRQAKQGQDQDPSRTYRAIALKWVAEQIRFRKWRPSYHKQVVDTLEREVFPKIGHKDFSQVSPSDFRNILIPIRDREALTVAKLVQQWCVAIGHYGVLHGAADINTAASLRGFIKTEPREHHKHLEESELPLLFKRIKAGRGTESVRLAILLLAHTFVRPSELRCAVWSEFDFDRKLWIIPGIRMKKGREHKVPLTPQVIALLGQLKSLGLHKTMLFPNNRDKKRFMSPTTLNRYLERLGYGGKFSSHGFRSTASTLLNTWNILPDAVELQLAHLDKNLTRRSYNHAEYMKERIEMMEKWSSYLASMGATSITLGIDSSPGSTSKGS